MTLKISLDVLESGLRLSLGSVRASSEIDLEVEASEQVQIKGRLFWQRTWVTNEEKPQEGEKEFLSCASITLSSSKDEGAYKKTTHLDEDGAFVFDNLPARARDWSNIVLEVELVCRALDPENKRKEIFHVVSMEDSDQTNYVFELPVSTKPWTENVCDLGELEITNSRTVAACEVYQAFRVAHWRIFEETDFWANTCKVEYPGEESETNEERISIAKVHAKYRDVPFHEYGHHVDALLGRGFSDCYYSYDDDLGTKSGHGGFDEEKPPEKAWEKEYYETAWLEAKATFLSCVIANDPVFCHGKSFDYASPMLTARSGRVEHAIVGALWHIWKLLKEGNEKARLKELQLWTALFPGAASSGPPTTVFEFYENLKRLECPKLREIWEIFARYDLHYGYSYEESHKFTYVGAEGKFDAERRTFAKLEELYANFDGQRTPDEFKNEFYNCNGRAAFAAGATHETFDLVPKKKYIVPRYFAIDIPKPGPPATGNR